MKRFRCLKSFRNYEKLTPGRSFPSGMQVDTGFSTLNHTLKSPTEMKLYVTAAYIRFGRATLVLLGAFALTLAIFISAFAQQHISKKYPVGKNVRLELHNVSGEITVETWDRDEIKISATLESPTARFLPRQMTDQLIVDVMGDKRGRGDVGSVNFKVQVPASSS